MSLSHGAANLGEARDTRNLHTPGPSPSIF